jgi:tripartite-type tricarboxylate transporter receptor subunit TctC
LRLCGALLLLAGLGAQAQTADTASYPNRQVRVVVPYPAGGSSDIIGRMVAERLTEALGQTVIVENKAGAGGTLGATYVARAQPDGYTLCVCAATALTIGHLLYPNAAKPLEEYVPIMTVAGFAFVAAAGEKSPAKTAEDLIRMANERGDKFTIGAYQDGTPSRLNAEAFRLRTGGKALIVPYLGTNQALPALIAGDIDLLFDAPSVFIPHLKSGKIKALAVAQPKRLPELPDVPTLQEKGMHDVTFTAWYALVAPRGTPADLVAKIESALRKTWETPKNKSEVETRGMLYFNYGAAQTLANMRSEGQANAALLPKK